MVIWSRQIREVQDENLSVRGTAEKYSIPKSTTHDHIGGRPVSHPGHSPVLTREEENKLVDWIIKMAEVEKSIGRRKK